MFLAYVGSEVNPKEREVVVVSGASMHMPSRKDLTSPELDTLRESRNRRKALRLMV